MAFVLLQSFIGLGLSIGKATEKGHADYGTAWGVAGESTKAEATWGVFVALGSMAFAYSFVRLLSCRSVLLTMLQLKQNLCQAMSYPGILKA